MSRYFALPAVLRGAYSLYLDGFVTQLQRPELSSAILVSVVFCVPYSR